MFDHAKNYSNFNVVDDAETNSILHVFFGMKFQLTIKICKRKVDHFVSFFFLTSTFQPSFSPLCGMSCYLYFFHAIDKYDML